MKIEAEKEKKGRGQKGLGEERYVRVGVVPPRDQKRKWEGRGFWRWRGVRIAAKRPSYRNYSPGVFAPWIASCSLWTWLCRHGMVMMVSSEQCFFFLSLSFSWRDSSMLVLEVLTGHSQTYDQGRVLFAIPFAFYNKGNYRRGWRKSKRVR